MTKRRLAITSLVFTMIVFSWLMCTGFLHRKTDLYENMVNASVMISNDYSFGSGVFIADDIILTAGHVLQEPDLVVELNNGVRLKVDDFYIDDKEDIGFIFIKADELSIAEISALPGNIGDTVYLVGTPYEKALKFTITKGILSHLDRDRYMWEDLLQTDAEGAPGSSGSPLYDSNGNVIGICVSGVIPGGGVTLCESGQSILEAYERCMNDRSRMSEN